MNRVGAAEIALRQAKAKAQGRTSSDAFFPMDDTAQLAANRNYRHHSTGGSIRLSRFYKQGGPVWNCDGLYRCTPPNTRGLS